MVDEQIRTFDENHERHFIDMYIKQIRKAEANPNQNSSFSCNIHGHSFQNHLKAKANNDLFMRFCDIRFR